MERGRFIGVDGMNDKGQRHIAGLLADTALTERIGLGATTVFSAEDVQILPHPVQWPCR
jgi:hypothetical protein